jgi:hypothetical protein
MTIALDHLARGRLLGTMTRAWASGPVGWSWQPEKNREHETAAVLRRLAAAGTRRAMIGETQRIVDTLERRRREGKENPYSAWPGRFLEELKKQLEGLRPGSYRQLPGWAGLEGAMGHAWSELVDRLPDNDLVLDDPFLDQTAARLLTALADEWDRAGKLQAAAKKAGRSRTGTVGPS